MLATIGNQLFSLMAGRINATGTWRMGGNAVCGRSASFFAELHA